jgi:hypothetical protein
VEVILPLAVNDEMKDSLCSEDEEGEKKSRE